MASTTTLRNVGMRPSMRTKAGAMAHRHNVANGKVALIVSLVLLSFFCFLGMVQVSNQVNSLRSNIANLQDQQEFLEAKGAILLAEWNNATRSEIVTARAEAELNLKLPVIPAFVLVRKDQGLQGGSWQNIFQGFSQGTANAAEVPGNANVIPVKMQLSP